MEKEKIARINELARKSKQAPLSEEELLEQTAGFMNNTVIEGSYAELWSVRKMLRRFLWHDRIHAKAMYRMAVKTFGADSVQNTFKFIV